VPLKGLLVDFGGVLTTNVFDSFRQFCETEGLDPKAFTDLMTADPDARAQLRRVETGEIDEPAFSEILGEKLGISDRENLIDRLFAGMRADHVMIAAVKAAKAAGIRTGLVSNSIGAGRYDRSTFAEMYDGVVISAEVGLHKPQPEIFRLGAQRAGVAPAECVFVDDLRENCEGAEAVGMAAVLHRGAQGTVPELERLLGVPLASG